MKTDPKYFAHWRSTKSMTRRHLWRGTPRPEIGVVETRCNKDPAQYHQLTDDEAKPKCKHCIRIGGECPRCGKQLHSDRAANALSRRDSQTYICSPCGSLEGSEDLGGEPYTGNPYWRVKK